MKTKCGVWRIGHSDGTKLDNSMVTAYMGNEQAFVEF